jgi:hypothetical protein
MMASTCSVSYHWRAEIGVDARLVVEDADLDLAIGHFRECGGCGGHQEGGRHHECQFHE